MAERSAGLALLLAVLAAAPTAAQLPPAPSLAPELGPSLPRDPLPRLDWEIDGERRSGCVVTLVEGLGVVAARHCGVRREGLGVRFG
ncbi:MAG: hypothetical protein ACOC3D_12745, partial [Pseudomonadota bacterium]